MDLNDTLEHMSLDDIGKFISSLDGVLTLEPQPGDGSPEISWGDLFFYYAPDGVVPRAQPFATIVTKNYPDDERSRLDRPDTYRVNIAVGAARFRTLIGREPREPVPRESETDDVDPSTADVLIAHPVYAGAGWVSVVNPGVHTTPTVHELLRSAHGRAQDTYERRTRSK